MKKRLIFALLAAALILGGCGNKVEENVNEQYLGEDIADYVVFPNSVEGYVGDTMPFYDNGKFYIFYLADQRDGKQGYHPWAMMETEDFSTYEDHGVVIPYGSSPSDQDIALGTGSVIKDQNGLYHAFYTGHNDGFAPKEAVMHATSADMITWEKLPDDTFTGEGNYSNEDFRDPYVLYVPEENCYWMLVATRADGDGVIARYTSTDLSKWEDAGVFFKEDLGSGTNLECPTLIQYAGKWYLTFSDQWPNRQVHYRISEKMDGTFVKPANDVFDGNGFYAGRLETNGTDLFVVGWNATKNKHQDTEEYNWAGNMVTHKLQADADGNLVPVVNEAVSNLFSQELQLQPQTMTNTVKQDKGAYTFTGEAYEAVVFKELLGSYKLEAEVSNATAATMYGLAFNTNQENVGKVNIVFNPAKNKIQFYNTSNLLTAEPQSEIDYDFGEEPLHLTAFIADGLVVVYVDDEVVLTTRMYLSQGMNWGLFGIESDVTWENVRIYK